MSTMHSFYQTLKSFTDQIGKDLNANYNIAKCLSTEELTAYLYNMGASTKFTDGEELCIWQRLRPNTCTETTEKHNGPMRLVIGDTDVLLYVPKGFTQVVLSDGDSSEEEDSLAIYGIEIELLYTRRRPYSGLLIADRKTKTIRFFNPRGTRFPDRQSYGESQTRQYVNGKSTPEDNFELVFCRLAEIMPGWNYSPIGEWMPTDNFVVNHDYVKQSWEGDSSLTSLLFATEVITSNCDDPVLSTALEFLSEPLLPRFTNIVDDLVQNRESYGLKFDYDWDAYVPTTTHQDLVLFQPVVTWKQYYAYNSRNACHHDFNAHVRLTEWKSKLPQTDMSEEYSKCHIKPSKYELMRKDEREEELLRLSEKPDEYDMSVFNEIDQLDVDDEKWSEAALNVLMNIKENNEFAEFFAKKLSDKHLEFSMKHELFHRVHDTLEPYHDKMVEKLRISVEDSIKDNTYVHDKFHVIVIGTPTIFDIAWKHDNNDIVKMLVTDLPPRVLLKYANDTETCKHRDCVDLCDTCNVDVTVQKHINALKTEVYEELTDVIEKGDNEAFTNLVASPFFDAEMALSTAVRAGNIAMTQMSVAAGAKNYRNAWDIARCSKVYNDTIGEYLRDLMKQHE